MPFKKRLIKAILIFLFTLFAAKAAGAQELTPSKRAENPKKKVYNTSVSKERQKSQLELLNQVFRNYRFSASSVAVRASKDYGAFSMEFGNTRALRAMVGNENIALKCEVRDTGDDMKSLESITSAMIHTGKTDIAAGAVYAPNTQIFKAAAGTSIIDGAYLNVEAIYNKTQQTYVVNARLAAFAEATDTKIDFNKSSVNNFVQKAKGKIVLDYQRVLGSNRAIQSFGATGSLNVKGVGSFSLAGEYKQIQSNRKLNQYSLNGTANVHDIALVCTYALIQANNFSRQTATGALFVPFWPGKFTLSLMYADGTILDYKIEYTAKINLAPKN